MLRLCAVLQRLLNVCQALRQIFGLLAAGALRLALQPADGETRAAALVAYPLTPSLLLPAYSLFLFVARRLCF